MGNTECEHGQSPHEIYDVMTNGPINHLRYNSSGSTLFLFRLEQHFVETCRWKNRILIVEIICVVLR